MSKTRDQYLNLIERGPEGWLQRIAFVCLCLPSILYSLIVWLRSCLYRLGWLPTYRASVPVISVGNLTVGGTGKTPVVDYLVRQFVDAGINVAVVSRGYGGSYTEDFRRVLTGADGEPSSASVVGDEPFLLALKNPTAAVYVARKRRFGVSAAEAEGAECIILDDAFQHLGVARDLDVVLLDAKRPFGNGSLLPAGPLRETRNALQRAGVLILTRAERIQTLPFTIDKPLAFCVHRIADKVTTLGGEVAILAQLQSQSGVAFAGIAYPERFFESLCTSGLDLHASIAFADHCDYNHNQISQLEAELVDADYLITTEKDAVKLSQAKFTKKCYVTQLEVDFVDDAAFVKQINGVIQKIKRYRKTTG